MIYIVRHGQTKLNRAHVLQGRSDNPLNERGIEQARELSRKLEARGIRFARVYSSPLVRAIQTAEILAPGCEITVDERLIEIGYGPYEGADLAHPSPALAEWFRDFQHNPAPEGVEQLDDVVRRAGSFVEELRGVEEDVLVSAHAISMKGILEHLTPGSNGAYWNTFVGNCGVYAAEVTGEHIGVPYELDLT